MVRYVIDRFADIKILRYNVGGFDKLPHQDKVMLYYLSEAALWGRDIIWDQNCRHNLDVRRVLECIYKHQRLAGKPDKSLELYLKRIWFANGIHHHYSNDKMMPTFSPLRFESWLNEVPRRVLHHETGFDTPKKAMQALEKVLFDPEYMKKKVCLDHNADLVQQSAVNFYQGATQQQVEDFYGNGTGRNPLNSLIVCTDGRLEEKVWKADGMYGKAIKQIVTRLELAARASRFEKMTEVINALIKYYQSGRLDDFDQYNIAWIGQHDAPYDFINGFIEVYSDPLGLKGTWESVVQIIDDKTTKQIEKIAHEAQWFEDHSPIDPQFRKANVKGVSMNAIKVLMLGGDCYPATPIGINLPNSDAIREQYGSKSVTLTNITHAHRMAAKGNGVAEEFAASSDEVKRYEKYGSIADELHTQLHECLGHGSGQMAEGVTLDNLKAYGSTIEEARADLFALYYMADDKMQQMSLTTGKEVAWAHYDSYLRNGLLVQLARIEEGRNIEEAHMRNRHMISSIILERAAQTGAAEMLVRDGKHYVQIHNYETIRELFGQLLREVQRIKSTGDLEAARQMVETYGVRIDPVLHAEVRQRYEALNVAPFSGFVNPRLEPVTKGSKIIDATIHSDEGYVEQMLRYSQQYSTL